MIALRGAPALLIALALSVAAGATGACGRPTEGAAEKKLDGVKERQATRVLVAPVEQREMVLKLETTTRIESENQISVFPRAGGVVMEILAEEGDPVTEGQALARLDDREARIDVNDAETALHEAISNQPKLKLAVREAEARMESMRLAYESAERDHERNLSIAEGKGDQPGLLSKKDLDASRLARDQARGDHEQAKIAFERAQIDEEAGEAAVQRAKHTLNRARLTLSYMEITSPIHGVVAERSVRVGDTVGSTAAAFVVTDPLDLKTVFLRPQRELRMFQMAHGDAGTNGHSGGAHPDQEIAVHAEALPGQVFRGMIERVSPTIDPTSGNFRVTARMLDVDQSPPGARLLPGMLVRLEIVTERHPDALTVPKRAIRREGDRALIFVARDGVARSLEVEEGFADDDTVEVLPVDGELAPGELVVVVGNRDLEDGERLDLTLDGEQDGEPAGASDEGSVEPADEGGEEPGDGDGLDDGSPDGAGQDPAADPDPTPSEEDA